MKQTRITSLVGTGNTSLGMLETRRARTMPRGVDFGGFTYIVGEGVEDFTRAYERMDFLKLADSPESRALTYATLGDLLGEGSHKASVRIGFPIQLMLDKEAAQETRRKVRAWMVGAHDFQIDGVRTQIEITAVNTSSQPAGTYAAWALTNEGKPAILGDDKRATVAVCDVGFNTLDLHTIKPGSKSLRRFTDGATLGMHRAAETLRDALLHKYRLKLSLHAADALIRNQKKRIETRHGFKSIEDEVAQSLANAASGVISFVSSLWEDLNASVIIFTGGGAEALKPYLLELYPTGRILEDPVMCNALGLSRLEKSSVARKQADGGISVIGLDPGFGAFKAVLL